MDDLIKRLVEWPMHEKIETYESEMHIAETGNSYTIKNTIPVSPRVALMAAKDRIEAQEAEIARLREALRKCRRAVSNGREEVRRNVREIVDEAIEEHARQALQEPK